MTALLALPVIVIAAAALSRVLRDTVEATLPSAIFAITLVLYACGLAGSVHAGFWLLLVSIAALLGLVVWRQGFAAVREMARGIGTPGMVLFMAAALALFAVTRGMALVHYDEFSHWGRIARAMYLYGDVGPLSPVADLPFRDYPPASALIEYFVMRFAGTWTEQNLFWAYQLVIVSVFVPFMSRITWRQPIRIAVAALLMFVAPQFTRSPLPATIIDPMLAVLFGYLLALVFVSAAPRWRTVVHLSLGLAMLVMAKDSGGFFAGIVLGAYALSLIRTSRRAGGRVDWRMLGTRFAVVVGVTFATKFSWSALIAAHEVSQKFGRPMRFERLAGLLTGHASRYWYETIDAYGRAFMSSPIVSAPGPGLSAAALFALFAIVFVVCARAFDDRDEFPASRDVLVLAYAGALAYALGLLALYLLRFGEGEAVRLAGYQRYLGTYWTGLAVFVSAILIHGMGRVDRSDHPAPGGTWLRGAMVAWCALLLVAVPVTRAVASYATAARESARERGEYRDIEDALERASIPSGKRVLVVVDDGGNGFARYFLTYFLLEAKPRVETARPDDPDSPLHPDRLERTLAEYDYVVTGTSDPKVLRDLSALAEGSQVSGAAVYVVESDGRVLRPAPGRVR